MKKAEKSPPINIEVGLRNQRHLFLPSNYTQASQRPLIVSTHAETGG